MREFVSIQKLSKYYGDFCAVDGISLSVDKGEIFGLLGPNGAGKSTTLSVLASLISFDKGKIIVDGLDLNKDKSKVKSKFGIVPQDIAIYNHLSAIENVKFFASLYGIRKKQLDDCAKEALKFVGLTDCVKMKPKEMSGGMKRRLNIACGIAHNPELIIMDEPTVGVDAQSREHILNSIRILKERGSTVIYTSHYMQEVEEICERIAIMDHGKLIAIGTKEELVSLVTDLQSIKVKTKIPYDFVEDNLIKQLKFIQGVKNASIIEDNIQVDIQIGEDSIAKILKVILENNLPFLQVVSEVPNLDTTFLTLTGHELRD